MIDNDSSNPPKKQRPKRRRLFVILSIVIGLVMGLGIGELALRLYLMGRGWTPNCYATGLAFFVPQPNSGHTLRPNLRLRSSAYEVSVNRWGFRGPELKLEAAEGVCRIAVLGGSSVFGYLVPDGQESCRILKSELTDRGVHCEVLNAGVPGFNITQCRHRFSDEVARFEPDYVLLYLGWNDIPFLIHDTPQSLDATPPAPPLLQRSLSHSALYGFVRYRVFPSSQPRFVPPRSTETEITEPGAARFRANLEALIAEISRAGATPVISTQVMAAGENCVGLDEFLGES